MGGEGEGKRQQGRGASRLNTSYDCTAQLSHGSMCTGMRGTARERAGGKEEGGVGRASVVGLKGRDRRRHAEAKGEGGGLESREEWRGSTKHQPERHMEEAASLREHNPEPAGPVRARAKRKATVEFYPLLKKAPPVLIVHLVLRLSTLSPMVCQTWSFLSKFLSGRFPSKSETSRLDLDSAPTVIVTPITPPLHPKGLPLNVMSFRSTEAVALSM